MILSFFAFTADEDGTHSKALDALADKWTNLTQAIKSSKPSFSNITSSIKNTITSLKESKAATQGNAEAYEDAGDSAEKFSLKMLLLRGRALLLNAALGIGVGLLISWGIKTATEIANRVDNAASKAKEASDAATNTTSSLKELTDAYEELGDKSKWDTEDFDQAKDIQEEIFQLAKEQGTLDEDKLKSLNLQNGKYQEQLELLKQIKEEQIRAATDDYEKDADKQGKKLVKDAKDSTGWGFLGEGVTAVTSVADHKMAEDLQAHGFNIFKDIAPLGVTLGPTDINDADSIVDYYNQISRALKYLEQNYKEADLESKGVYEGLYNILSSQKEALDDQVSAYQDASDTLKENLEEVGKYDLSNYLAGGKKVSLSHDEIDAKVKATQEYKDAVDAAKKTEAEWAAQGESRYGNIYNFKRDKIDWTVANRKKYSQFVAENPDDTEPRNYSTVIGQWDYLSKYADVSNEDQVFTFSPMLQTDDGLVPLTNNQLTEYLHNIVQQATDKNGKVDISKLMELDATGLEQNINGAMMQVKGMIAGVEGGKDTKGRTLTRADILAISGDSNEEIVKDYYGKDADKYYGLGNLSRYVGKSMHDAQKAAQEGKDNIEAVYNQIYDDIENQNGQRAGDDPASFRYFDHIQSAFDTLAQSLGKDKDEMKISDVLGLTADGVELTDEQAQAIETLSAAASRYGTTIEGVAQAGEENGMFGGIEDAQNRIVQTAKDMETLSQQIDNIQKAYKSCSTAVDEYNKYGYMSVDALQSLLSMDYEYLSCMELVNGKLVLNNDAFAQMVASKYADAKVTAVQNAIAQIQAITQDSVKESTDGATEAMDDEVNKLNELSPGLGDAIKGTVGLATAQDLLNAVTEKQPVNPDRVQTILDGLNTQLSVIDSTIDTILGDSSKIKNHLNGFNKNNKSKSASKSVTDVASAFDTLTKAMKEYNQYGYISADTMKSMMKLEDKFTSCLVKNGDKLEINANEFRKLVETQLKQEEASGKASKSADELKRILSYLDSNVHSSTISFEQLTDVIKGYGTAMDDAKEKTDAIKSAFSDLYDVGTKKKDNDFGFLDADSIEKKYQAIRNLYDKTDLFTNPAYKDALNPETGEINYDSDAFRQMFADHLAQLATSARKTGGEAGEYLAQGFEDAAAKIANNVMSIREYIDGIGSSLNYATDRIDHFQSGFSDISDIVNEYNTYGGLSIDNYQKLMSLDDDYIKCLSLEEGQLKFNTKAYKELFIAKLNAMINEYDAADETKALAQRLRELKAAVENSGDGFTMATDSAKNFEDTLSNIKSLLSDLIGVFEKFNTDKSNDLKIQGDAWLEVIDKRIDALNEANDAQERAIELQKAQDALAKAEANKTVHVYHANGTGFEWEADQNAVRDAQSTLNDTIRNNRKEDELDRLNKLKDAVQKNNELIGSSFEDYEKKKKYLAEFDKMTYDQMIEYNDTWKDSILGNMKSTQTVTNVNNVITSIEKLLNTLQTLNNVLKWIDSAGASTDGGGLTGLFSNGGLLSKVGKFFNIASKNGLGAALNKTGEWFSGKLSATLEANPNNPIIKAFSNIWTKVGEGAGSFFSGSGSTGLGGIIKTGIKKIGAWVGNLGGSEGLIGQAVTKGGSFLAKLGIGGSVTTAAATGTAGTVGTVGAATAGTAFTSASSAIPIIGPIIAVAVNNAVQQFGKISKKNTEIWADQNSSTGEKIVKSIGNVLYHLSPVEGWDLAAQYAEKAANGDGI